MKNTRNPTHSRRRASSTIAHYPNLVENPADEFLARHGHFAVSEMKQMGMAVNRTNVSTHSRLITFLEKERKTGVLRPL